MKKLKWRILQIFQESKRLLMEEDTEEITYVKCVLNMLNAS
jgi:hypothetical protein